MFIRNILLHNYMPRYVNPKNKQNNFTFGFKTCISSMLPQYKLNKLRLRKISNFDNIFQNYASACFYQKMKDMCETYIN